MKPNGNEFEIKAPYLPSLTLRSPFMPLLLVIIGLFALLGGVGYSALHIINEELTLVRHDHQVILAEQAELKTRLSESLESLAYILTLPEGQRPKLMMPRALRERVAP